MQNNREVGAGVPGGPSCASARGRAREFSFAFTAVAMMLPGEYRIGKLALGSALLLIHGTDNSEVSVRSSHV